MHIYLATSWKNRYIDEVHQSLQAGRKNTIYDFRRPSDGSKGFHWEDVDPNCGKWTPYDYKQNLNHPLAECQFEHDIEAMKACDACVLILPCGRSAHSEAGWFAGQGKPVYVYIPTEKDFEPELMYKLFRRVCTNLKELNLQICKDNCLMAVDNLDYDWGTEDEEEQKVRIEATKSKLEEVLTDDLITGLLRAGTKEPKDIVSLIIKDFIRFVD